MVQERRQITPCIGGKAGELAEDLEEICCEKCGKPCTIGADIELRGYIGAGGSGYQDEAGNTWWMYVTCPKCGHDTSVEHHLSRQRIEKEVYGQ